MNSAVEDFRAAIRAAGLNPPDAIQGDGKLHRFASNGTRGDDSGWYVFHDDARPAGAFGDWRSDVAEKWQADGCREWTPAEAAAHRARVAAIEREREAEAGRRHAEAAAKAARLWKAAQPAGADHAYLARKSVAPVATLRELPAERAAAILGYPPQARGEALAGRLLVAPIKIGDAIATAELIDESGRKAAIAGGAKAGGYWAAQALPEGDGAGAVLLIGEGVATVVSAREATGHQALAALSCGNLARVAHAMRQRYPAAQLVILADLGNGEAAAEQAARDSGALLVRPDFGAVRPEGATDFNDLAAHRGRVAVERCIANGIAAAWPDPLPLTVAEDAEPYPVDALPGAIGEAVAEVVGFVKCPPALAACSALSALSVAGQALADVRRADRLEGPVSLYLLAVANPASAKRLATRCLCGASVSGSANRPKRRSLTLRRTRHDSRHGRNGAPGSRRAYAKRPAAPKTAAKRSAR